MAPGAWGRTPQSPCASLVEDSVGVRLESWWGGRLGGRGLWGFQPFAVTFWPRGEMEEREAPLRHTATRCLPPCLFACSIFSFLFPACVVPLCPSSLSAWTFSVGGPSGLVALARGPFEPPPSTRSSAHSPLVGLR